MCDRSCYYSHIQPKDPQHNLCGYCLDPDNIAEGKTRTGELIRMFSKKDHKRYNSSSPRIKKYLKGENCPFFIPKGGHKRHIWNCQ